LRDLGSSRCAGNGAVKRARVPGRVVVRATGRQRDRAGSNRRAGNCAARRTRAPSRSVVRATEQRADRGSGSTRRAGNCAAKRSQAQGLKIEASCGQLCGVAVAGSGVRGRSVVRVTVRRGDRGPRGSGIEASCGKLCGVELSGAGLSRRLGTWAARRSWIQDRILERATVRGGDRGRGCCGLIITRATGR